MLHQRGPRKPKAIRRHTLGLSSLLGKQGVLVCSEQEVEPHENRDSFQPRSHPFMMLAHPSAPDPAWRPLSPGACLQPRPWAAPWCLCPQFPSGVELSPPHTWGWSPDPRTSVGDTLGERPLKKWLRYKKVPSEWCPSEKKSFRPRHREGDGVMTKEMATGETCPPTLYLQLPTSGPWEDAHLWHLLQSSWQRNSLSHSMTPSSQPRTKEDTKLACWWPSLLLNNT